MIMQHFKPPWHVDCLYFDLTCSAWADSFVFSTQNIRKCCCSWIRMGRWRYSSRHSQPWHWTQKGRLVSPPRHILQGAGWCPEPIWPLQGTEPRCLCYPTCRPGAMSCHGSWTQCGGMSVRILHNLTDKAKWDARFSAQCTFRVMTPCSLVKSILLYEPVTLHLVQVTPRKKGPM
jgi:hypothetical protein